MLSCDHYFQDISLIYQNLNGSIDRDHVLLWGQLIIHSRDTRHGQLAHQI